MTLLSSIVLCLTTWGLTGCEEDVSAPEKVCVPSSVNHPPTVTIEKAYAEGVLRGEPVVLSLIGSRDTVPMGAKVTFEWTGEDPDTCDRVVRYRFRSTDEDDYRWVGHDVTSVTYTDLPSGLTTFSLAALDKEGAITDPEIRLHFVTNFNPDTWYDAQFIEKREIGGTVVDIVRHEGDTVAVGAHLVFLVHGTDPDGDDHKLRYSHKLVTLKTCGGGSNIPFSYFDDRNTGPTYIYDVELSLDPRNTGLLSCWSRTMDEHGRVDGSRAEFRFYSNLPPVFGLADVLVNGYTLELTDSLHTTGSFTVTVTWATDPDPGDGPATLETRCALQGLDVQYSEKTEWQALGEEMVLGPMAENGRYELTVSVSDYGCRQSEVDKEILITVDRPDPTRAE
jgi:hypothetical protein